MVALAGPVSFCSCWKHLTFTGLHTLKLICTSTLAAVSRMRMPHMNWAALQDSTTRHRLHCCINSSF